MKLKTLISEYKLLQSFQDIQGISNSKLIGETTIFYLINFMARSLKRL